MLCIFVFYRSEEINITLKSVEDKYLMLNELGRVLYILSCNCPGRQLIKCLSPLCVQWFTSSAAVQKRRTLSENILKSGQPHLIVVPPGRHACTCVCTGQHVSIIYFIDRVLRAALSLYMEDINLPMPTPEEMLICNQHTTDEEVYIDICTTPHELFKRHFISYTGNHFVAKSCV